jgi:nucleoid-associated protein YgaU
MLTTHIVVEGDTLWNLAQHYYGEARLHPVLAAANAIVDPKTLEVGRTVIVPDLGSRRIQRSRVRRAECGP